MAIDTIGANALASNSVTSAKIAEDAVIAAKIGTGAVGTEAIADGTVTNTELANDISISTTGNIATTGSGTITSAGLITATGSVAIGGTGAVNTLDDYEEGTWTANLIGSNANPSTAVTSSAATYTKVGRMVYARWLIGPSNVAGATGGVRINGLPFSNAGGHVSGNVMMYYRKAGNSDAINVTPYLSGDIVYFFQTRDGHIDTWAEILFDTSGGAANFYMYASVVYETAS